MTRQLIAETTLLSEAEVFAAESPLGGALAARSGHEARARPRAVPVPPAAPAATTSPT